MKELFPYFLLGALGILALVLIYLIISSFIKVIIGSKKDSKNDKNNLGIINEAKLLAKLSKELAQKVSDNSASEEERKLFKSFKLSNSLLFLSVFSTFYLESTNYFELDYCLKLSYVAVVILIMSYWLIVRNKIIKTSYNRVSAAEKDQAD